MSQHPSIRVLPADCAQPADDKLTASTKAYGDPTGELSCGIWRSKPNRLEVSYTKDEFCFLIEGEVHLTDDSGITEIYRAGDGFVVPAGFKGVWDMPVPVAKYYVLHAPRTGLS